MDDLHMEAAAQWNVIRDALGHSFNAAQLNGKRSLRVLVEETSHSKRTFDVALIQSIGVVEDKILHVGFALGSLFGYVEWYPPGYTSKKDGPKEGWFAQLHPRLSADLSAKVQLEET